VSAAAPRAAGLVPLPADFFARDPLVVAAALLGCRLVARARGALLVARLVETEAYGGPGRDPGAHSFRGETPRCRTMFGPPGRAYVFTSHRGRPCLNVTVGDARGEAVLLRAAEPLLGVPVMRTRRLATLSAGPTRTRLLAGRDTHLLASGPVRLSQSFGVRRTHDGLDLLDPTGPLWLAAPDVGDVTAVWSRRVGLAASCAARDWLWRACDPESAAVSSPRPDASAPRRPSPARGGRDKRNPAVQV